ncbi:MAG TPA: DUF2071 domain-containing protein [Pirellulales bacterium]|nr:DUF2071 domain-containing protein [Pirellulales bacterium]
MRLPEIKGIIERRMLVNFRTSPAVAQAVLPAPFRPQLHRGYAIVGICLIRLGRMRPAGAPSVFGLSSENAAHRIAVEWTDEQGELRQGVYVPRRDTNSWINSTVGGRLFPGQQHRADFQVTDASGRIDFSMLSRDGAVSIRLRAAEHDAFPPKSCFRSLDESSRYFEGGSLGYSLTRHPGRYDGLRLLTDEWQVRALRVEEVASSYFSDRARFPTGSIEFDHALLMRNVAHSWRAAPTVSGAPANGEPQTL